MTVMETTRTIVLPSGEHIPVLGQGTWHLAENPLNRTNEINALRLGIDLGMSLIDTAEMYADGGAERLVGEAINGRRDEVFLVSKVLPQNATRHGTMAACNRSLARLGVREIDLYLLHWRGSIPLAETLEGFEQLRRDGKIRHYGVSNFDRADLEEWVRVPGGANVATNQILYNLTRRGPEFDVIPWCRERNISIMAYSPIEQGRMLGHKALADVAARHGATPAQIALAWLLRQDGMIVIPKASRKEHVREDFGALDVKLTDTDLADLDRAFPPPKRKTALGML